jgi:AcrR family transcriptional regulator
MATKAEQAEVTRGKLLGAARDLFSSRGYAAVGTEEVVRTAGVTRGALYHHFADKRELFRAVYERLEAELAEEIGAAALSAADPLQGLRRGAEMFLERCADPALAQVALIDARSVLGWEEWREVGARYGLGLIEAGLAAAMEAGAIRPQPVRPLAHVLLGALDEAALMVAPGGDPPPPHPPGPPPPTPRRQGR